MTAYSYGQQPSDLTARDLSLGWLSGVRHLKATSASGSYWPTHEAMQLLFCIKGEFAYEFRDRPQEVLTAGHFIVIPMGCEHRLAEAIDPAGHRVEMLVSPEGKGRYSPFPSDVVESLVTALSERTCQSVSCSRELTALFLELDALASRGAKQLSSSELALARTLSCLVLQRCATQRQTQPIKSGTRLIREAIAWLESHYSENVRLERLVSYMGYSRSRLFELFKHETGLTPADWLSRYRIKWARKLLRSTSLPIAEIARACGYASAQYFNAAFKKQTGSTPSEWRKRN